MLLKVQDQAPNFKYDTPYLQGQDFYASLKARYNLLCFSRYIGCSLCQLKLMETVRHYDALCEAGAEVFFIMQSTEANAKERLEQMGVHFPVILDPEEKLYHLYEVAAASAIERTPRVVKKALEAKCAGIEHGAYEGNELQLPATFIVSKDGVILYARYGQDLADVPSSQELLDWMEQQKALPNA